MHVGGKIINMVHAIEMNAKVIAPRWGDVERADAEQLQDWIREAKDIEFLAQQLQRILQLQLKVIQN